MQTFLPYSSFEKSAKVLDDKRLGKQRVEAYQILRTLLGFTSGWRNHPAVKMWKGYEASLFHYAAAICREWMVRGFNDTMADKLAKLLRDVGGRLDSTDPPWLGNETFHASHRSNLLRKNPNWYGLMNWSEPDNLPYVWPI